MASPSVVQRTYNLGIKRDSGRHQLPQGSVWNLVDYLPSIGGAARKRGGYSYASTDLSGIRADTSFVEHVIYADFFAGAKLVAIDEDAHLWTIDSLSTATDVGAAVNSTGSPVFHRDKVLLPSDGATAVKTFDGTNIATPGTAPLAQYATVYKDYSILARTAANRERLYFSNVGDPSTWDTTNSYIDTSFPVTALASLRSAILVFSLGHTERIRGNTPPPSYDMNLDPLFDVGCTDERSVAIFGDYCIFANPGGVWMTDGAGLSDLTEEGGIKQLWQAQLAGYSASYTLAAGIYRGFYVIAVMNGSNFVDCLMCDVRRRVWFRQSNIKARCFGRSTSGSEELYFGLRSAPRVASFSSTFSPVAANKLDADGTPVAPVIEYPFFTFGGLRKKSLKHLYLGYDMRDAGLDDPRLTVSYVTSPESTSYVGPAKGVLNETTTFTRARFPLGVSCAGIGIKIAQSNPSVDTYLYDLEIEGHAREGSRR